MYSRIVNAFSATAAGSWVVKHIASEIDPLLFRATNGRFTTTGIATLPMLCMTVVGRKSGKPRHVQLAYHEDGGGWLVVASAMGQARHPGWRYSLEANPEVELQMRGERFAAQANLLDDMQKERIWPAIKQTIPQMNVYENRTDRNIRVFRLTRID